MDPPRKRPRLSMFNRSSIGPECDDARYKNDMVLKNRLESIFTKYAQDFTGIGDEVDIMTGEVIVNNGHLERMEAETDAGISNVAAGDFSSTGRSMLRAMTVAPDSDVPGPDDVLASIETIAENAGMIDDASGTETEDDLFDTSRPPSQTKSTSNAIEQDWSNTGSAPYNSDSDSLFEENMTEPVVSDLLPEKSATTTSEQPPVQTLAENIPSSHQSIGDDDEILAKFGPQIGKEVLSLIDQRQEAHIEPAWRIPVKIGRNEVQRPEPLVTSSPLHSGVPETGRNKSLWSLPVATRHVSQRSSSSKPDGRESVDPLQEDFQGDSENGISEEEEEEEEGYASSSANLDSEDEDAKGVLVHISKTGSCPYCYVNFRNKQGVMAHWDRCLRQRKKRMRDDDAHDFKFMKKIRSVAKVNVRFPRVIMYDLRTMIELHEGAGMTFDEIAASETLRSQKPGRQLQEVYYTHRSPPSRRRSSSLVRAWSKTEEDIIQRLCKDPLLTTAALHRVLKGRDMLEIGDYLAEIWLTKLGVVGGQGEDDSSIAQASNVSRMTGQPVVVDAAESRGGAISQPLMVKSEEPRDVAFE